jgi:hypothetical protein
MNAFEKLKIYNFKNNSNTCLSNYYTVNSKHYLIFV